jgi:hypothetical protein
MVAAPRWGRASRVSSPPAPRRLAEHHKGPLSSRQLRVDPSTLPLNNAQRAALGPLRRSLDTYGDLLVAEAVYHVVSGRSEVAGAAMDAATGPTAPPNLEVISTRRTGRGVNTNVVVALPAADSPPVAFDASPGEIADSAVAAFLATIVGRPPDSALGFGEGTGLWRCFRSRLERAKLHAP